MRKNWLVLSNKEFIKQSELEKGARNSGSIDANFAKGMSEAEFGKHYEPIFASKTKEAYKLLQDYYAKTDKPTEKDADTYSGKRSKSGGDKGVHNSTEQA